MDSAQIDLWLDWQAPPRAAIVVPYAKASAKTAVEYLIVLDKEGQTGRARISQGGKVLLLPGVATPLSRVSVDRRPQNACTIEISVGAPSGSRTVRRFDCPEAGERSADSRR